MKYIINFIDIIKLKMRNSLKHDDHESNFLSVKSLFHWTLVIAVSDIVRASKLSYAEY